MHIFLILLLALLTIVVLLRFRVMIGLAILAAGAVMWVLNDRSLDTLVNAGVEMATASRTYDLILALYFVMCLEVQLRKSGTLRGMVEALNRLFSSARITIAVMPAFLGLLPSLGGARFSAPIVQEASRGMDLSPERKSAINYYFRHTCETSSPTVPGILLAVTIANIHLVDLVLHLAWVIPLIFAAGWFVMIRPIKESPNAKAAAESPQSRWHDVGNVCLAISPVVLNILLMLIFEMPAGIAMGCAVLALIPTFWALKRWVPILDILKEAFDLKLLCNVAMILYFIGLLTGTGVLDETLTALKALPLPMPVIFAMIAVLMGLLTGMSQGYIAMTMPICAVIAPGSLDYAGMAMVFGFVGQMLTPVHLCFTVTLDYFKADFFKTLKLVFYSTVIVAVVFSAWTWFSWSTF
ncbi:DUF401 family protein [Sutterella sp.]|uniref:DUF401 family protein n=1 Tax=Sutterella sp. TaxID=1981025 RepID=UPI0026DF243D|nr:DUF401 family protein [Sutterella sp.]MDO5532230.1 DUF401 family protein [Sutterella sp.]